MRGRVEGGRGVIHMLIERAPGAGFLRMAEQIAAGHREWFDGMGYPHGQKGPAIALADVYDAIKCRGSFTEACSHDQAVELVRERSGSQFDPIVVDAFLKCEQRFADLATEEAKDRIRADPPHTPRQRDMA